MKGQATEPAAVRIKRLRMRSWRRGMREMDLILGPFADGPLASLPADQMQLYERLLEENDHDIYRWFAGQAAPPADLAALVALIGATHAARRPDAAGK